MAEFYGCKLYNRRQLLKIRTTNITICDTVESVVQCPKDTKTQQCYFSIPIIIKIFFNILPLLHPCLKTEFETRAVWSTEAFSPSNEDRLRLSLHQTELTENMKQTDMTENLKCFVQFIWWSVFSFGLFFSSIPCCPSGD